jgi:hypothetical protein
MSLNPESWCHWRHSRDLKVKFHQMQQNCYAMYQFPKLVYIISTILAKHSNFPSPLSNSIIDDQLNTLHRNWKKLKFSSITVVISVLEGLMLGRLHYKTGEQVLPEEHSSCVSLQWASLHSHGIRQRYAVTDPPVHQHHCTVEPYNDMQKLILDEQGLLWSAGLLEENIHGHPWHKANKQTYLWHIQH